MFFFIIVTILIPVLVWEYYQTKKRQEEERRRYEEEMQLLETVTPRNRGEMSERKTVLRLLRMGIDNRAIFHDCYVRKPNGEYTQIDLVVATKVGLLVFEIKDYSGWIFGNAHQKYWTQMLAYGKEKHRFYNPIMQNNGHIQALRDNLKLNPNIPIYSIVLFFGRCELKNVTIASENDYLGDSSYLEEIVSLIISKPEANFGDKYEIMNLLTQSVANGNYPNIVNSQIYAASKANRNKPQSTYSIPIFSFYRRYRNRYRF